MRRFVLIGQRATASADFLVDDVPGTSGRLDVLIRCVRAALLVSHGVRRDTVLYLVLLGGSNAPRTVRIDGAEAKFLRPDERSLATLLRKTLAAAPTQGTHFGTVRPGIAVANAGLEAVLADAGASTPYRLDEAARDVREVALDLEAPLVFVGDHLGFDDATRARLDALGARTLGLGPVSVHAEDAVTLIANELDRQAARNTAAGISVSAPRDDA